MLGRGILLTGCLFIGSVAMAATKVLPLDALTMIDPKTGKKVVNENGGSWKNSNPIWDGKAIKLTAAKGEILSFQLVITREPGDVIEGIRVEVDAPDLEQIDTARAWCIWGTPEIAVPLKGTNTTFDLPSKIPSEVKLFTDESFVAWPAWVEFAVPRKASGNLKGKVTVTAEKGLAESSFPLEIKVLPFEMPRRPNLIVEMNSYGDYTKHLGKGLIPYKKIHKLMRRHRCTFVEVPYNQGGNIHEHLAPRVNRTTGDVNWTGFDKRMAGLFDGSAFEDGQPVSHFIMPFCYSWPSPFNKYRSDPDEYRRVNIAVRKSLIKHIKEKGWTRTVFQEFHNENPQVGAKCPWHLDEPRSAKDLKGHELYTGFHREAIKELPEGVRFNYRIDVSHWKRIQKPLRKLAPSIDDWVVSRDPKYLNANSAPMFRKWADARKGLFLEYGEVAGFNSNGKKTNWSAFIKYTRDCWVHRSDGFEQWMIDMWKRKGDKTPLFYSNAAGARDLIWPGKSFGVDGPLPSLRLKAIREGTNLFDYAKLAAAKDAAAADSVMKELKTGSSEAVWKAKARLASLITP